MHVYYMLLLLIYLKLHSWWKTEIGKHPKESDHKLKELKFNYLKVFENSKEPWTSTYPPANTWTMNINIVSGSNTEHRHQNDFWIGNRWVGIVPKISNTSSETCCLLEPGWSWFCAVIWGQAQLSSSLLHTTLSVPLTNNMLPCPPTPVTSTSTLLAPSLSAKRNSTLFSFCPLHICTSMWHHKLLYCTVFFLNCVIYKYIL